MPCQLQGLLPQFETSVQVACASTQHNQQYHTRSSEALTMRNSSRAPKQITSMSSYTHYAKTLLLDKAQCHPSAHTMACTMLATSHTHALFVGAWKLLQNSSNSALPNHPHLSPPQQLATRALWMHVMHCAVLCTPERECGLPG